MERKDVSDTDPPIFTMDSLVDLKIECEEEDKFLLTEEIILCIRYEETTKFFSLGNIIEKTSKDSVNFYDEAIDQLKTKRQNRITKIIVLIAFGVFSCFLIKYCITVL